MLVYLLFQVKFNYSNLSYTLDNNADLMVLVYLLQEAELPCVYHGHCRSDPVKTVIALTFAKIFPVA